MHMPVKTIGYDVIRGIVQPNEQPCGSSIWVLDYAWPPTRRGEFESLLPHMSSFWKFFLRVTPFKIVNRNKISARALSSVWPERLLCTQEVSWVRIPQGPQMIYLIETRAIKNIFNIN